MWAKPPEPCVRMRCAAWHLGRVAWIPAATEVELSFTGLRRFSDLHLHGLASHLPKNLESLHLDATGRERSIQGPSMNLSGVAR